MYEDLEEYCKQRIVEVLINIEAKVGPDSYAMVDTLAWELGKSFTRKTVEKCAKELVIEGILESFDNGYKYRINTKLV